MAFPQVLKSIYNDCVPESTCFDFGTDYGCTCGPGLTGDGRFKVGIRQPMQFYLFWSFRNLSSDWFFRELVALISMNVIYMNVPRGMSLTTLYDGAQIWRKSNSVQIRKKNATILITQKRK